MSLLQDSYQLLNERQSLQLYSGILISSQIFGGLTVALIAVWMGVYSGGFAWNDDPSHQFNYHPMFMVMGLLFLCGEALMVYRIFRNERKRFAKLMHVTLHSVVLLFVIIALVAVWNSHDLNQKDGKPDPIPNLYSLHSWIGIMVVGLYSLQYCVGFVTFFYPGLNSSLRQFSLPFHQIFGIGIFCLITLTVLMGVAENAAWKNLCWTKSKELCGMQWTSNCLGIATVAFSTTVLIIVLNPRWKRREIPEEESLQQLHSR